MADHDETNQNNLNPEKAEANARIERDMALALKRQNRAGILGLSGMLGVVVLGGVAFAATQGGSGTSQPQPQPHAQVLAMHSASVSPKAQRSLAPSKATVKANAELVTLAKANTVAQKALWAQVTAKMPSLKGSHGVISPQLAGLGSAKLATKPNAVVGSGTLWSHLGSALMHPPASIAPSNISQSAWESGWKQAATDAMTVVGNDPISVMSNVGPGSQSVFQPFVESAYVGQGTEISAHYWTQSIVADVGPYQGGPTLSLFPVKHQMANEPTVIALMRVPMMLTERVFVPSQTQGGAPVQKSETQSAVTTMALTDVSGHYAWWIESLGFGNPHVVTLPGSTAAKGA